MGTTLRTNGESSHITLENCISIFSSHWARIFNNKYFNNGNIRKGHDKDQKLAMQKYSIEAAQTISSMYSDGDPDIIFEIQELGDDIAQKENLLGYLS